MNHNRRAMDAKELAQRLKKAKLKKTFCHYLTIDRYTRFAKIVSQNTGAKGKKYLSLAIDELILDFVEANEEKGKA